MGGFYIKKMDLGSNIFIYPMPVTLLGTKMGEKANFMALGWISRVNANPPLLAVAVNKTHLTNELIRKNKLFSINFPSTEMIKKTDYCGLNSGRNVDKSELFQVYYGKLEKAPLIEECPLSLECKLEDIYEMPTNDLFIAEIICSHTEKKYLKDGKLDINKINPLLLTMPDNKYWMVGDEAGKAWNIGRNLK